MIDISATRLPEALAELAREAGVSIGTEGSLPVLRTRPLHGRMSIAQALARLLAGSGYTARQVGPTAWLIERATRHRPAPQPSELPSEPPPETASAIIIVTAAKRPTALDDLPMAVTVLSFTPEQSAEPANGTARIASEMEGLALTSLGPGRNRMFLRGVADSPFNGESQSTVAVMLDEARLTYAAPDPDIRLVDVKRVEVVKGPQGSLYGTGALGGIYHIVTRRAEVDDTSLTIDAGLESVAHGDIGWSGSAVANLPLVPGKVGLRLVGYGTREAGWIDTGNRKDSNLNRIVGARANLGIEAGGGWRADLSGLLQLIESRDSHYVYAPGAYLRDAQLPEPHDNDMRHLSARLSRLDGPVEVMFSTGFSSHEVGDTIDATIGADSFGLARPSLLEDKRTYQVWDSEARFSGNVGRLHWLAGLSHVDARQTNLAALQSFNGTSLVIDDDRRRTQDTALFGDLSVPLGGGLSLDAGARLFSSTVVEIRVLPGDVARWHRHRSGITPSLALSWKAANNDFLYLRYGSAFRQGGLDIKPAGQIETLKDDELATIEAGWRHRTGQSGSLDIGLFASSWENLQSDLLQPDGLIETENAGNARIYGVEATFSQQFGRDWRLDLGANYTEAMLVRSALGIRLDDRRLPVVPSYSARMAVSHSLTLGRINCQIRASVRYIGPQRLNFDPLLDRPMGRYFDSRIEAQAMLAGYRLALVADNLSGGSEDSFAFGNSLRFAALRQYTPQRPAIISLGLMKEF